VTFESLEKTFLTFFQLAFRHDNGLELLFEFKQTSATHIANHIHEWHRKHGLCKEETTKQQFLNWFLISFVPLLAKDVASTFPQSEEEAISKAQQYDLIYSQLGYLYTVLPDALRLVPFGQDKPEMSHSADGLIGTTTHQNLFIQPKTMYDTPQTSTSVWRNPLLPSSPLSTTILYCSPPTHEWTHVSTHDAPYSSTKF
jgi:hypothetical protein